ncbi:MAG: thymidylate kinase, partial [Sphingomonadaceae bacterium]
PVAEGARRAAARSATADRMGAKAQDYYERVALRFRDMAAAEADRFRLIDAMGAPEAVSTRLMAALDDLL